MTWNDAFYGPPCWTGAARRSPRMFASDVVGSGLDWRITSGISDEESVGLLRGLQRKLPRWRGSMQFTVQESGSVDITDPERPDL